MKELQKIIIADRNKHPERTNATLERIVEVMENVLGPNASGKKADLENLLKETDPRAPLSKEQALQAVDFFDGLELSSEEAKNIMEQLSYAEIATAEAIDLHHTYKIPVSHPEEDIIPVKGDGCWIMDTKGKRYLDMDSNYSAANMGMTNPEVALGLYNQANTLITMKEDRVQIARTRLLKEIMSMMPEGLNHFYWQNSGGEAVDKALKFAKAYTGTTDVIAFKGSFHGRTHGAVAITWEIKYRKPFGLDRLDWVHFAHLDIADVERLMDETGAKIVILEIVQGEEGGNKPPDPEFIKELWELVHKKGGIIIDDEVQTGFGRTALKEGDWFACMSYDVVPDIMVIGKTFGGGYPVTAVVTNRKISEAMQNGYDGSTFGGNPMAMTAALIATRQMRDKNITMNVIERSRQLFSGLHELKQKHSIIEDVQGIGLMVSFSVGKAETVAKLQEKLKEHGVKSSLSTQDFIRFLPLTIINKEEVDYFLRQLDMALSELSSS